jgi:hypothetical protein
LKMLIDLKYLHLILWHRNRRRNEMKRKIVK